MIQDHKSLIQEKGLKVTKSRLGVLEYLSTQDSPSDAQQIHRQLLKLKLKLDLATVYRILEKFQELDMIKPINFEDGKVRYELSDHHHHHLVCEHCGKVEMVEECQLDKVSKKIEKLHQFHITRHSLEFFGLCSKCAR